MTVGTGCVDRPQIPGFAEGSTAGESDDGETTSGVDSGVDSGAPRETGGVDEGTEPEPEDPPSVCGEPDSGTPVDVTVWNQRNTPLMVSHSLLYPFGIEDQHGEFVLSISPNCSCGCAGIEPPCINLPEGGDILYLVLQPGAMYTVTWHGRTGWTTTDSDCLAASGCDERCSAEAALPSGAYTLVSSAAELNLDLCPSCDCTPDANGVCMVRASADEFVDSTLSARTALMIPETRTAVLAYD
jgi:hypothetical protein